MHVPKVHLGTVKNNKNLLDNFRWIHFPRKPHAYWTLLILGNYYRKYIFCQPHSNQVRLRLVEKSDFNAGTSSLLQRSHSFDLFNLFRKTSLRELTFFLNPRRFERKWNEWSIRSEVYTDTSRKAIMDSVSVLFVVVVN